MKNHTLECSHFPGQHTGSAIYYKLCQLTSNWGISLPLTQIPIYVGSDNARNMSNALTGKPVEHLSCAAHSLQLAVRDAVVEREATITPKKLSLPENSLFQMVDTRWNSSKKKQCLLIAKLWKRMFDSTGMELDCRYVTILQPLFLATKELCRENVPTLSMVRPILYGIEGFLKNYISSRTGDQGSGIRLARALLKSLND
ncbi:hypothetical protein PR048_008145 [Dryococelus australis]|uniref:Transposase n=1 Tax=Dryococelus australis TaxID=614101 RepID=A0ABQ9HXX2_9NEOP|nr:hypothetical protein PR048_008145 [Dryococelus australis]